MSDKTTGRLNSDSIKVHGNLRREKFRMWQWIGKQVKSIG